MDHDENIMSPMDFPSIELPEVPVAVSGKNYVIRKANSDAGRKFRSMSARCIRMTDGELSGIDGIGDVQPYLVSLCLYQITDDGGRVSVPVGTINCWPDEVVKSLFERCRKLGNLEEVETVENIDRTITKLQKRRAKLVGFVPEELAKNAPSGTTAGSA